MSIWEDYQKVLLLGTQRSKVPELAVHLGLPQDIANHLQQLSPEAALCHGAQLLDFAQRIDVAPATGAFLALPAVPEETLPLAEATTLFEQLFQANDTAALQLFVKYGKGYRLPAVFLPQVLAHWNEYYNGLQQGLLPMLGQRGIWLAQLNPDWKSIVKRLVPSDITNEDQIWELGTVAEREEWLTRAFEADAEQAKQLVRSSWSQESATERKMWLGVWRRYITAADEDFWEAALQDRSKDVRSQAISGLQALPQSAWRRRMWARLQPCLPSREDPEWKLPTACTPDMVQDGIEAEVPKDKQIGERSWWLEQLVITATLELLGDPHTWCDWVEWHFQTYPKEAGVRYIFCRRMIEYAVYPSTLESRLLWYRVFEDRKLSWHEDQRTSERQVNDFLMHFLCNLPVKEREEQLYRNFEDPYYAPDYKSTWFYRVERAHYEAWSAEFSCFYAQAWYQIFLQHYAQEEIPSPYLVYNFMRIYSLRMQLHTSAYSIFNQPWPEGSLTKYKDLHVQYSHTLKFIELHARIQQLFLPASESPSEV